MPLPQQLSVETGFRLPGIASQDVLPFALFLLAAVSLVPSRGNHRTESFREPLKPHRSWLPGAFWWSLATWIAATGRSQRLEVQLCFSAQEGPRFLVSLQVGSVPFPSP